MSDETEQSQLAENLRFFGDMRFKQLTLFMAAMTAVAGGVVESSQYRWWIALGGLCITGVMWVMEIRSTVNFNATHERAKAWWPRPKSKLFPWLTATNAVLLLYVGFYAFWLFCLKRWCSTCCFSFFGGLLAGLGLVVFSVANYLTPSKSN